MALILTEPEDFEAIRGFAGVQPEADSDDLSDTKILSYLSPAEVHIKSLVAAQAVNGVPSASTIMGNSTQDETALDNKASLKAAVQWYIVSQYAIAMTNSVNTAVTDEAQTIDLGGIGAQWIQLRQKAEQNTDLYLSLLTGWKAYLEL